MSAFPLNEIFEQRSGLIWLVFFSALSTESLWGWGAQGEVVVTTVQVRRKGDLVVEQGGIGRFQKHF